MALDREAAKARCEAATPGPWHVDTRPHDERPTTEEVCDLVNDMWVTTDHHLNNYRDDAAFIAHARTDLPAAIAEIDALEAESDALKHELARVRALVPLVREACDDVGHAIRMGRFEETAGLTKARDNLLADAARDGRAT